MKNIILVIVNFLILTVICNKSYALDNFDDWRFKKSDNLIYISTANIINKELKENAKKYYINLDNAHEKVSIFVFCNFEKQKPDQPRYDDKIAIIPHNKNSEYFKKGYKREYCPLIIGGSKHLARVTYDNKNNIILINDYSFVKSFAEAHFDKTLIIDLEEIGSYAFSLKGFSDAYNYFIENKAIKLGVTVDKLKNHFKNVKSENSSGGSVLVLIPFLIVGYYIAKIVIRRSERNFREETEKYKREKAEQSFKDEQRRKMEQDRRQEHGYERKYYQQKTQENYTRSSTYSGTSMPEDVIRAFSDLDLPVTSSFDQIKEQHRKLSLFNHPDHHSSNEWSRNYAT